MAVAFEAEVSDLKDMVSLGASGICLYLDTKSTKDRRWKATEVPWCGDMLHFHLNHHFQEKKQKHSAEFLQCNEL